MHLLLFCGKLYQFNVWPWPNGSHLGCFTHNSMSKVFCGHITRSDIPENRIVDTKIINLLLFCRELYQFNAWPHLFNAQNVNGVWIPFFLTWIPPPLCSNFWDRPRPSYQFELFVCSFEENIVRIIVVFFTENVTLVRFKLTWKLVF